LVYMMYESMILKLYDVMIVFTWFFVS
jgi:hypothetical protein